MSKQCTHPLVYWTDRLFFCPACKMTYDPPIAKMCPGSPLFHTFKVGESVAARKGRQTFLRMRSQTWVCARCDETIRLMTDIDTGGMWIDRLPEGTLKKKKDLKVQAWPEIETPTLTSYAPALSTSYDLAPPEPPPILVTNIAISERAGPSLIEVTLSIKCQLEDWMGFYEDLADFDFDFSRCGRFRVSKFMGIAEMAVTSSRETMMRDSFGIREPLPEIVTLSNADVTMKLQGDRESWLEFYRALRQADYMLARLFSFEKRPRRDQETKIVMAVEKDFRATFQDSKVSLAPKAVAAEKEENKDRKFDPLDMMIKKIKEDS